MKLEFSGAALGVTGSKHLLHVNGKKILLDCGLFQGHRKQAFLANRTFPFNAKEIDAVVLSHAHIDHSGALPLLVKEGFTGSIFCTHATRDLCAIMLRDSGYIQEKDTEWIRKKMKDPKAEPIYTIEDAEKSLSHFRSVSYEQKFSPVPGVWVTFSDAGHILGSAEELWEIDDQDTKQKIRFGFTGDLGRRDLPILKDPTQLQNLDALITESTYGNRLHDEIAQVEDKFADTVNQTIAQNGKIIIPSFAVERTQEILYVIRTLQKAGKLPEIPIFVDSPLATNATEIFRLHVGDFDEALRKLLDAGEDPFAPEKGGLQFTQSVDESKALNEFPGSAIIISANGMCEAGRILHHLKNCISDPRNTVLVVGFMAENTLGRKLVEGENPVNIFGEPQEVRAKVVIFNAFSGHADQKGLLRFASQVGNPKSVFCVHGEENVIEVFRGKLQELPNLSQTSIEMPAPGEIFELQVDKSWKKLSEVNTLTQQIFSRAFIETPAIDEAVEKSTNTDSELRLVLDTFKKPEFGRLNRRERKQRRHNKNHGK